jgi:hypothetical protein
MRQQPPPALLSPALAGVVLVAFLVSGLMTGVLTRGLVDSVQPVPTATAVVRATNTPAKPTPSPTLSAVTPSGAFDLGLTPSPAHAQPGATVALTVIATSGGTPVRNLLVTLGASRDGGAPLLSSWPPSKVTDASGQATWQVTAPSQPGTYTVQVAASGANNYAAWGYATVYVG